MLHELCKPIRLADADVSGIPYAQQIAGLMLVLAGLSLSGQALDRQLCLAMQTQLPNWPTLWQFFSWSALGICACLLVLALSARQPRRFAALLICMLLGGLLVHVVKYCLHVDRPLAVFGANHPIFHVLGPSLRHGSMPSGHSAMAWCVASVMVMTEVELSSSKWRHLWWALAGCQAISRVAVGAHWPSDVLVGSGMGLVIAPQVWQLRITHHFADWLAKPSVSRHLSALSVVLCCALLFMPLGWALPWWCQAMILLLSATGAWSWWQSSRAAESMTLEVSYR